MPMDSSFSGVICLKKYTSLIVSMIDAPILVINRRSTHTRRIGLVMKNKDRVAREASVKPSMSSFLSPILSEYLPSENGRMMKGVSMIVKMSPISFQEKPRCALKYRGVYITMKAKKNCKRKFILYERARFGFLKNTFRDFNIGSLS